MRKSMSKISVMIFMLAIAVFSTSCTHIKLKEDNSVEQDVEALDKEDEEDKERVEETFEDDVFNNGKDFVQVGNRVYFRDYSNFDWSNYILMIPEGNPENMEDTEDNYTYISYYDLDTKKTERVFVDEDGIGPIFYAKGRFYMNDRYGNNIAYSVNMEGDDYRREAEGDIKYISEDGKYLITSKAAEDDIYTIGINVYENGSLRDEIKYDNGYSTILDISDQYMFYEEMLGEEENYSDKLYYMDIEKGDKIYLGDVDLPVEEEYLEYNIYQIEKHDDIVYMCIEAYNYDDNTFKSYLCKTDEETQKIEIIEPINLEEDSIDISPKFIFKNGKPEIVEGLEGDMNVKDNNLYGYNENGDYILYKENIIHNETTGASYTSTYSTEYINGDVYVSSYRILNTGYYNSEEATGSKVLEIKCEKIDKDTKEVEVLSSRTSEYGSVYANVWLIQPEESSKGISILLREKDVYKGTMADFYYIAELDDALGYEFYDEKENGLIKKGIQDFVREFAKNDRRPISLSEINLETYNNAEEVSKLEQEPLQFALWFGSNGKIAWIIK